MLNRLVAIALVLLAVAPSFAKDLGQWPDSDLARWFASLRQPDNPTVSCCGEADAYWADSYEVGPNGEYVAIITDTRDDKPLQRRHVDPGTRIVIPPRKLKFDQGNPTGHGIVFLGSSNDAIYCYLPPGGV